MIPDFVNTVQKDVICIYEYTQSDKHTEDQDQRVCLAALRMIAAFGMAVATVVGITACTATPVGSIFILATAVALYAVSHDAFVMAVNAEKKAFSQVTAVAQGIIKDFADVFMGNKSVNDAPRHPITAGTLFRPLWDWAMAKI
jgi:hypothetical protein